LIVFVASLRFFDYTYGFNVLATQYSMWTSHAYNLGVVGHPIYSGSIPNVDTVVVNGKYFDTYAPGLEFLAFPFSALGFVLDRGILNPEGSAIVMLESFVAFSAAVSCYLVYRIWLFYGRPVPSSIAALTLGFGTSVWPFALVAFPHDTSMMLSLFAAYLVLRMSKSSAGMRRKILYSAFAGLSLGVAAFTDYLAVLLIFPLAAYVLTMSNHIGETRLRAKVAAALGLVFPFILAGPGLIFSYNAWNFGSPLVFPEEFYKYTSPSERTLGGLASRFHVGYVGYASLYNLFSPYRGIFVLSPVLLFGAYGLYRMIRSKKFRADALLFLALFLTVFVSYSTWSDWSGGAAFGPRFIVPALPYLVIPTIAVLELARFKIIQGVYCLIFFVSALTQGIGGMVNSTPPVIYPPPVMEYQLTSYSIPELLSGKVGIWWLKETGAINIVSNDILSVAVILAFVFSAVAYLTYKNIQEGSSESSREETIFGEENAPRWTATVEASP
jgi:hypothetical protein